MPDGNAGKQQPNGVKSNGPRSLAVGPWGISKVIPMWAWLFLVQKLL
mgnify:CR=1 FL=1|jgi:hypothetical protein